MRGRRNPDKPPTTNILPPCRVCGEPSTGLHYGVTTCTACKGFFRRSLDRHNHYMCMRNRLCFVGPRTKRRHSCPSCRYNKCIAVGMSKDAVKIGRYSMEKKMSDWKEAMGELNIHPAFHDRNDIISNSIQGQQPKEFEISSGSLLGTSSTPNRHKVTSRSDGVKNYDTTVHTYSNRRNDIPDFSHVKFDVIKTDNSISECDDKRFLTDLSVGIKVDNGLSSNEEFNEVMKRDFGSYYCPSSNSYNATRSLASLNSMSAFDFPTSGTPTTCSSLTLSTGRLCDNEHTINTCNISSTPFHAPSYQLPVLNNPHYYTNHMQEASQSQCSTHVLSTLGNPTTPPFNFVSSSSEALLPQDELPKPFPKDPHTSPTTTDYLNNYGGVASCTQAVSSTSKKRFLSEENITEMTSNRAEKNDNAKDSQAVTTVPKKKQKHFNVFLVTPSALRCSMSILERFPFKSFEQKSLAPILKHLYDDDNSLDNHLPRVTQHKLFLSTPSKPKRSKVTFNFQPISIPSLSKSLDKPLLECEFLYDATEMDKLLEFLRDINCRFYGPQSAHLSASEVKPIVDMYVKICEIQNSLQGNINYIDDDKYYTIFDTTGVDLDKRGEWFSTVFETFDERVMRDIRFFRALPGFKDLQINDRMTLMTSRTVLYNLLTDSQTTDLEKDVVIWQREGVAFRSSTSLRIIPATASLLSAWPKIDKFLKEMDVSYDELLLLKAVAILLPDGNGELEEPELLLEWNTRYICCLLHHLRKTLGPVLGGRRFSKFLDVIQMFKDAGESFKAYVDAVKEPITQMNKRFSKQRLLLG